MKNYFRYDVNFVMNITDVDDKIILRARQRHLLEKFKEEHASLDDSVLEAAKTALGLYVSKNLSLLPHNLQPHDYAAELKRAYGEVIAGRSLAGDGSPAGDKEAKIKMHIRATEAGFEALLRLKDDRSSISIDKFYALMEDVLLPYLDNLHGSSIDASDYSIFKKLTHHYEDRFMEDMRALNVEDPDIMTRVSEYIPQIISFTEKIVKNGFAYTVSDSSDDSSSSVYFDISAFEKAGKPYARLEPWNRNNQDLQADGEGALTKKTTQKRSDADFALWKSSKPGEPIWPSPWGKGRPGWHVECSAMASAVLGGQMDIHSGGIDLCFPHHDNELAQSEAYWARGEGQDSQWVNYFLHTGHLSISGSKMSKSLKNFITIREALEKGDWTPRGLRIVFLLGGWKDGVEITDDLTKASIAWESKMNAFFLKAKDLQRSSNESDSPRNQDTPEDGSLGEALQQAKEQFHAAMCDSFDTGTAMILVSTIVSNANRAAPTDPAIVPVAKWITSVVQIFGLDHCPPPTDGIGFSDIDIPEVAKPFVYPLSQLRDEIRQRAISGEATKDDILGLLSENSSEIPEGGDGAQYAAVLSQFKSDVKALSEREEASPKEYLALCDQLRNTQLWNLGIYIEDRENQPPLVRPVDKELIAAREERVTREEAKKAAQIERERQERERLEQGKLDPKEMFKTDEYSSWDTDGFPTRDADGQPVGKSKEKKLRKLQERQSKLHEAWRAAQNAS